MKKSIITRLQIIWFKLMNDQMTRNEAIALFVLLMCIAACICYLASHIS